MKSSVEPENQTLIDSLLDEQRQFTPVERFSRQHEKHKFPLQQKYYRDLIPLSKPGTGEQYGFEVDLDSCSGCKACVVACHSLNGLDENETWRKVGTLVGRDHKLPFQQTVTTACHHCVDPGCLNGCPVEAYEKDFATGIVRHLDDQCIGCQYCLWTCAYDVPQYSAKRGIVRKCDMCHGRLAVGEAPACVQACPNGAIAIRIVSKAEMIESARKNIFLPTEAPDPNLTIPTTRYLSAKPIPKFIEWPERDLKIQPAHFPLVAVLVLTQMSVGIFLLNLLTEIFSPTPKEFSTVAIITGTIVGWLGLFASVLHLGRPLQAWRSFLGWRHSWLSREVICFGAFASVAMLFVTASTLSLSPFLTFSLSIATVAVGLLSIFCSAMVYHATKRDFWHLKFSAGRFFGTTVLLGIAAFWALSEKYSPSLTNMFGQFLVLATLAKVGWEISFFKILDTENRGSLWQSAHLMKTKLRSMTAIRLLLGFAGGIVLPIAWLAGENHPTIPLLGFALCLLGELAERYLFFATVSTPKMPGEN